MGNSSQNVSSSQRKVHSPRSASRIMVYGQNSPSINKRINEIQYIITDIYSGHEYDIYRDHNHQLWIDRNTNTSDIFNRNDSKMNYFHTNHTRISKVCNNVMADHIFWIGKTGTLYASGLNGVGQLGLGHKQNCDINTPQLVECFDKKYAIINVQSVSTYSLLLCTPSIQIFKHICEHWSDIRSISHDIIQLIMEFYGSKNWTQVFSTGYSSYGAHCHDTKYITTWKEISFFENVNIINIAAGRSHSLFLQNDGTVWVCGDNKYGQLGFDSTNLFKPNCLQYFIKNHIKIKSIACGENHSLAIDLHGNVYGWGQTKYGQCGRLPSETNIIPQLIPVLFPSYDIVEIDCGAKHSYCKSRNRKHFLFGSNKYNECITYDNRKIVCNPHCINKIIQRKSYSKIKRVFLGYYNTKVIVNKTS